MAWDFIEALVDLDQTGATVSLVNGELTERGTRLYEFLNGQGRLGWDLVSTLSISERQVLVILKRALPEADPSPEELPSSFPTNLTNT